MRKLACIFLVVLVCSCNMETSSQPTWVRVDNEAFQTLMDSDSIQLIDVRTPGEFATGRLKGAILINVNDANFTSEIEKLAKDKKTLVYCAAGGRSQKAAELLVSSGFEKVYDLKDGMKGWVAEGRSIELD